MSLTPGTRIGPYEVLSAIGSGGMGEVYRATDTRLDRTVALKILPDTVARDSDRLARFEREAKTLASLNHPNIAQVYGFEDRAIAMELLEGETLRARLERGFLPVRKAIDYGAQIARGLAAAHERGVIHRDLKPENVFVLRDGHVKILDFGLARQMVAAPSAATETVAQAPVATDPGIVMGTVGYMSPEQVRGEALDARTDLFALGAVLHEMLTGQRAFRRDTTAETMTAILKEDPPELTTARGDVTPALDRIVRHCLEKNAIERFQTARDVAFALDALSGSGSAAALSATSESLRANRERWIWAVVTAALAGLVVWQALSRSTPPVSMPPVYRSSLVLPEGLRVSDVVGPGSRLALSPDGRIVAFTGIVGAAGTLKRTLWLQSASDGSLRELPGTENAISPFWSPDSRQIGFLVVDSTSDVLKKVDISGGVATKMSERGGMASWGSGDTILFSSRSLGGIYRVGKGGQPELVYERPASDQGVGLPSLLPDGGRFLFTRLAASGEPRWSLAVRSLNVSDVKPLMTSSSLIRATFANNALIFAREGTVFAQRFDPLRLELSGDPVTIATNVDFNDLGGTAFTVSQTGALIYQTAQAESGSKLVWMKRDGNPVSTMVDVADYSNLKLSHDGRRLAVSVMDEETRTRDIYVVDVARGIRQRLTFDPSEERSAVWSADDRQLIFNSKGLDLYARPSDFTGADQALQTDRRSKDPNDVSSDGKLLIYRRSGETTSNDLWVLPLDGQSSPRLIAGSPFDEANGVFSPDAQSIAYSSDESGQAEIYVISLAPGGGKIQISANGGLFPRWRKDGREIVYLTNDREMMSVPVKGSGAQFQAGAAARLFQVEARGFSSFDVTADGERFIVNVAIPPTDRPSLTLVVNWPELLKK